MGMSIADLQDVQVQGPFVDRSGAITLGGTAQTLAAANPTRHYLLIQNISAGDLWINFGVAAVLDQPSIKLAPGAAYVCEQGFIPSSLISIIGATTGQKWVAKEG